MRHRHIGVGQLQVAVVLGDLRVIPLLDFAEEDPDVGSAAA
jgi:hypothetical protein